MTGRLRIRERRGRLLRMLATVSAAAAALAACTGVPVASAPETIQPVARANQAPAGFTPRDGEAPRQIVNEFLHDNSVDPRQHTAARLYLTSAARNRWTDTTATIIADERVGTYQAAKKQLVVTGRIVGKLDADGIFTPYLQASGHATQGDAAFVFGIQKVDGQFRISNPRGLLLTDEQFEQSYRPKPLYFFDLSNRYLVPDQRWSALQGVPLEEWLVGELANGPSDLLQSAVNSDTMPAQANTRNFAVTAGNPSKIEIPGSAHLEGAARNRLAAQVGTTLNDVLPGETFIITDGGRPVTIPASGSTKFAQSTFGRAQGPEPPTADVYYLRGGQIVDRNGSLLNGRRVNDGSYFFTSVALTRMAPGSNLTVAAVADGHQLLVGSQFRGLTKTGVHGDLSRPAWAPGWGEVWIGDGDKIYRVLAAHPTRKPLAVQLPAEEVGGGRIVALQLSAEGTRLAVVIEGANGTRRLYVGAVTRTGGKVRVDALNQVSPVGVSVDDVDWIEPLTLVAIGEHRSDARIFSVNVDGSMWSETSVSGLPARPDFVTVSPGQQVWVSVGSGASATVWEQQNTETWQSPGRIGQTPGTAPQYLE